MTTSQILQFWSSYMHAENCTTRTIREREIFVRALVRKTGRELLELQRGDLILFLGRSDLSGKTKQNYRSTMHTLFTWMQDEGFRADNPAARLPRPRVAATEPDPVTTTDLQAVLDSGIYGHTRMKVLLYAYQGLRASEIAAVAGENIDWARQRILTVDGKGRKEVWRPLHSLVWEHAQQYPRAGVWFPSPAGGHVRGKSVSTTLNMALRRAGIKHRAHQLRAWYINELLNTASAGVDVAQHAARHARPETLRHYSKPTEERIRAAAERLPRVVVPITAARRQRDEDPPPLAA